MHTTEPAVDIFDPDRWGLPADAVASLSDRLHALWTRVRPCFTTSTRDGSLHAWTYLRGVLTMTSKRTFANIARRVVDPADDGQALQQFMSDSPWSAQSVIDQVQLELVATPALHHRGMLILDESADAKAGVHSAGAARQWNGRLGKVDLCQVGTFLAFATDALWTWIDGELFLPEHWFAPEVAAERTRLGIPPAPVCHQSGPGLADDPARARCWGPVRGAALRRPVWSQPVVASPGAHGQRGVSGGCASRHAGVSSATGRRCAGGARAARTLADAAARAHWRPPGRGQQVASHADTLFRRFQVRDTERGVLSDAFAVRQVWTIHDGAVVAEWLVMRQQGGTPTYALSNAPATTAAEQLVDWKCRRFAIECANHDAKAELGWGDVQAQKYLAWEHHLALTILAGWFVAQTKAEWATSMGGMARWPRSWA